MSRIRIRNRIVVGTTLLLIAAGTLYAQDALPTPDAGNPAVDPVVQRNIQDWAVQQRGLPDDWSHHYLVFSNPGTRQQAIESGKFEEWLKIVGDPRFTLQQIKRSGGAKALEGTGISAASTSSEQAMGAGAPDHGLGIVWTPGLIRRRIALKKDWAVPFGGVAASGTGTVTTNNAGATSTITVDGQTLTASAPTTATGTGIFSGAPGPGQGVTITYGANVLHLAANGTASSVVGTVSAAPTSTTAPTITLTNSAGVTANTLSLTTSATGATATGTVSGAGPTTGQTITIKNGANTLTLTAINGVLGTGTVSVSNAIGAANGDVGTVGFIQYVFEESTTAFAGSQFTGPQYYCPNTTTPCVWWGTTSVNTAQALLAALTNNQAPCPPTIEANGSTSIWLESCYSYITAANPSVTATRAAGVVTLTNITGKDIPFSWYSVQNAWTLVPNTGFIPGYAAGTNACTSATAGTFSVSSNPSIVASNLANAINACNTSFSAVGVTASATANVVTIASTTLGSPASSLTLSNTASNFVWSIVTTGNPGSNGCSSATAGTFASGVGNAAEASNIAAAINACNSSYPAVGVTASYTSGNTFTVSGVAAGPYLAVGASNNVGLFSWGALTAGTAGTRTCPSSTTGTFVTSNSVATLATNLAAAINACPAAAGVTAIAAGPVVTLTARVAGSTGNCALATTTSNFTWSGTNMTGGTDGTTSGTTFAYWSGAAAVSATQMAANIASAISQNTTLQTVVTATSSGNIVTVTANAPGTAGNAYGTTKTNFAGFAWGGATLTGGTAGGVVQPNLYPAKYSFSSTTASCTDFVVYPAGTTGAATAASIVAFTNIYTGGCSGTVPSVYWSYNTGGMATTSPVPSLDGKQVMFVQVSGTTASLVLLKWSAGAGTLAPPVTLTPTTLAAYRGCTAPCMTTLAFSGPHNDSFSAPFYDFGNDIVYVGDDSGNLHKFTGVFAGTPAESGAPWPVNLSVASKLASPVYDSVTGYVIVGDFAGVLHSVTASTGAIHGTASTGGDAIADAPLVDSTAGRLYAFVTTIAAHNTVYELPTNFTTNAGAAVQQIGTGAVGDYLYSGTFDNVYYSSATFTGSLYAVGNTGANAANLYRIPLANSIMAAPVTVVAGLNNGGGGGRPWPSPLNEFCNNGLSACTTNGTQTTAGTDYIFFSVYRGNKTGCTNTAGNGCVLSYNVSNPAAVVQSFSGLNVTTPGGNGCWATGGFVLDNSSTFAGASQIYFIGLGSNPAGGSTGATSANCNAGAAGTMSATQTSQANP